MGSVCAMNSTERVITLFGSELIKPYSKLVGSTITRVDLSNENMDNICVQITVKTPEGTAHQILSSPAVDYCDSGSFGCALERCFNSEQIVKTICQAFIDDYKNPKSSFDSWVKRNSIQLMQELQNAVEIWEEEAWESGELKKSYLVAKCKTCDFMAPMHMLHTASNLFSRFEPGDIFTKWECPICKALCYPKELPQHLRKRKST